MNHTNQETVMPKSSIGAEQNPCLSPPELMGLIEAFEADNRRLKAENDRLRAENGELSQHVDALKTEYERLDDVFSKHLSKEITAGGSHEK